MTNNNSSNDVLLDFNLLSRLVVGIGEVSDMTGIPRRKIRYWEEKGIIQSEKDAEGSTRRYNYINIKKVLLIKELLEDGYTLDAAAQKVELRMKSMNETFRQLAKFMDKDLSTNDLKE
ncbi:MerR family transcriptional regulator [Terrilactibacillus sp. BCM23-1]|uniref:MerR family transcriptional regulator n=1 Tax=Terrilactibacillus tamarindi TaxID=2599694 RepID=A0A6N8CT45_9BACI|nr:MerR family transcriptional regulator [Terrilactibacillus tamarindi]MTT33342.1 MerR family transcriptional regulator [Terrilactibacillus tamarindi]